MSKREKILLTVPGLFVGLYIAVALVRLTSRDRTYDGRTLAEWAGQIAPYASPAEQEKTQEARAAIRAMCTNDLPDLVQALDYDPAPRQIKLRKTLGWLPRPIFDRLMASVLDDRKAHRIAIVEQAFWGLGSNAAPAIPALTKLMYNTNVAVAMNAVIALSGGVSPNSLPALLQAAADPACSGRYGTIYAIGRCSYLGTNAKPIVPVLVRCTQDKEPQIVIYAVQALGNLAMEPAISVPAIEEALKHHNDAVRRAATNALASFAIKTRANSAGH